MTRPTFSPTDLNQLHRQLSAWRRQQVGRVRLPEAMWTSAATLARSHGASLVARVLHLDYYKLRQRAVGHSTPTAATPTFVELQVAEAPEPHLGDTTVELSDGTGARMTLRVRGEPPTVVALAESFWRRGR